MNLAHLLARAGRVAGESEAIAKGARAERTYRALAVDAGRVAQGLIRRHALARGARVAILMKNSSEYVTALFGCWWAGLIAVPINAKLHAREIAVILADCEARVLFTTPDLETVAAESIAALPFPVAVIVTQGDDWRTLVAFDAMPVADCAKDEPAWLFYTSGTTGRPKGATLSHANLRAMCAAFLTDVDTVDPGDGLLHAAPMSHGSGLYILPYVMAMGRQVIPESGGFDPAEIHALLGSCPRLSFFAAPTMVGRLVRAREAGGDARNLKTIVYGGGPMYVADTLAAIDAFGPRLAQIYGQGESPMTITVLPKRFHAESFVPRFRERLATVGYAQSVVEVAIGDADGTPLASGCEGEVMVRGDTVMLGYWNDPQATARAMKGGWLVTGDVGVIGSDGMLTLKDRSKDVIISGGSNIYPREIEEVLLRHPDVLEVSVIGRPHSDWGEEVVAFVVAHTEVSGAELDRLCEENIARFKRPKAYRFVQNLPKNSYGKVLKTELRRQLAAE